MKRFALFSVLAVMAALLAACGPSGTAPDESGTLTIYQEDGEEGMNFNPENVVLTAGQTVRIVLENHGSKDHEFMVGRDVNFNEDGAPDGFGVDFFEGIEDAVQVEVGSGAMLMIDGETVMMGGMGMDEGEMGDDMGMDNEDEMDMEGEEEMALEEDADHEEGEDTHMDEHMGWMVMNAAESERTIIEFTVPEDRVGEWEMACFEDDGTHYDDGMRGTLTVVAP